jgi:hypothetical protein
MNNYIYMYSKICLFLVGQFNLYLFIISIFGLPKRCCEITGLVEKKMYRTLNLNPKLQEEVAAQ